MLFCVLGYCVMEFKWNLHKKLMIDTRGTGPEVEITPRNLSDFSEFVQSNNYAVWIFSDMFQKCLPHCRSPIAGLDEERLFRGCLAN